MKGKDILGSISPLYGALSGNGLFGEIGVSPLSSLIRDKKKKKPVSEEVASDVANAGVAKFKSGGRVDGCAIKGMTKGAVR
tara:strand:+ start:2408 stop:2650 length:243 start_codon:yes stop_codon:yes gene_type:complete